VPENPADTHGRLSLVLVSEISARMATNTGNAKDIDLRKCAGVGQGISKSEADNVREQIKDTPPTPFYRRAGAIVYPFEMLDSDLIKGVIKPIVDSWLRVRGYKSLYSLLFTNVT
jgi:hypothetical protein